LARPVYSKRLAVVDYGESGLTTYPVPSGVVWDVRDVELVPWNGIHGCPLTAIITVGRTEAQPFIRWVNPFSGFPYQWQGRVVLVHGETLELNVSDPFFNLWVTGYELTTP
jgi:hypothetical protein